MRVYWRRQRRRSAPRKPGPGRPAPAPPARCCKPALRASASTARRPRPRSLTPGRCGNRSPRKSAPATACQRTSPPEPPEPARPRLAGTPDRRGRRAGAMAAGLRAQRAPAQRSRADAGTTGSAGRLGLAAQQRRSLGPPGNGPARPALDGSAGPGHAPAHRPGGPGSGLWPRSGMPPGTARSARLDRIGRMSPVSSSNDPPPAASVFATWRSSLAITVLGAIAAAAALSSGMLWQKLGAIQEQLARQSAESGALAIEARTMARQAQELVRETAARLSVAETRISEVALQRKIRKTHIL